MVSSSAESSQRWSGSPCGASGPAAVGVSTAEGLKTRAWSMANRPELPMFTLIVVGSSRQTNADLVWSPLYWALANHQQMIVRHTPPGEGRQGVELLAQQWCRLDVHPWNYDPKTELLVLEESYPDNAAMVAAGASACYAFPYGRHRSRTWECMALAWAKGIPVFCWSSSAVGRFHEISEREGFDLAKRMLGWGS